jgi:site-specific DNA-methyltransferase (adenine-specific)
MSYKIIHGDNIDTLKQYPDNHFDSIVTDPPYGIEFLGKDWDNNTGAVETWEQCFRVLKPGGHLLAFSAARTYHNLATNIEGAGFDIRDQLMWLYASGFPKAQDIGKSIERREGKRSNKPDVERYAGSNEVIEGAFGSGHGKCKGCGKDMVEAKITAQKQSCQVEGCEWMELYRPADNEWAGWKTALKPAHEPIVMARKPFKGSTIDNVLKHGTGALNIDATRIPFEDERDMKSAEGFKGLTGDKVFKNFNPENRNKDYARDDIEAKPNEQGRYPSNVMGEVEGYQKFFYCPKVSRTERHCGFEQTEIADPLSNYSQGDVKNHPLWDPSIGTNLQRLKHKILEHNKDLGKNKDPLAHISTDPAGMFDHGTSYMQHKDSLSHIDKPFSDVKGCYVDGKRFADKHQEYQKEPVVTFVQMLEQMGGHETEGGGIWLPHCGEIKAHGVSKEYAIWLKMNNKTANVGNNHPTVKPVELMKYLVRLVTPENGKVLDPFNGSGSTGMACVELGYEYVGCELDQAYVDIATKRIEGWIKHIEAKKTAQLADNNYNELFE